MASLVSKARAPAASLSAQHAAFTELVRRSQHIVFAVALTSLRDVDDAKDAAQDAFAIAWRRLRQLRDPSAFPAWMRSIVSTVCARRRRRREPPLPTVVNAVADDTSRLDYQTLIAEKLQRLPVGERHVTVLFYFLGYSQTQIARLLRLEPGTVGKRLHSARLRIRRELPRSVRRDFVPLVPSAAFAERVRRGLLDEYVGSYRFVSRPDHVVSIMRRGDVLVSEAAGQRHVLVSGGDGSLLTTQYDGEGRFRRDRTGRIIEFVYYEFGRRLGVARRVDLP